MFLGGPAPQSTAIPLRDEAKIAAWKRGTLGRQISWANLEFGANGTTTDPSTIR
jgi:hypothetical protein